MQLLYGFAVAIALLATTCAGLAPPSSRGTGYTASVDLKLPQSSVARGKVVLESGKFQLWLEGDDLNKCSLSVREKYVSLGQPERGYLVWTANYFSGTPTGAENCTLIFTAQGELQLWIAIKGKRSLTWSSKTGGKDVTSMALGTRPDNGNFELLTRSNEAILSSFALKQWLVLSGQKFWAGELLKSPDQEYLSNDTRILALGGKYIMAIKGGDLQLLMNGPKPQLFWSFKKTSGFKGDISKAVYAARVEDDAQGIGLFTSGGKLVYRIAIGFVVTGLGADWHFGIDFYGNLKYYLMYRGATWGSGWQAVQDTCLLPNFCGRYGVCTSRGPDQFGEFVNECIGCPRGFEVDSSLSPPGCKRIAHINMCNHAQYLELKGYESGFLPYQTPTEVSLAACKASCSSDCNCDGVFYKAGSCYKQTQILTLKKGAASNGVVAYIKVLTVLDTQ